MSQIAVGARYRVLRGQKQKPPQNNGFVRLYSQYLPGLPVGDYDVSVTHTLNITHQDGSKESPVLGQSRKLEVRSPQFSLDPGAIHSVYPPPGAEISSGILPHIVLHDAVLPWARTLGIKTDKPMPWLCLMAFDPAELLVPQGFPTTQFPQSPSSYGIQTSIASLQTENAAFQSPFVGKTGIQVSDKSPGENIPADNEASVSIIVPSRALFTRLFPWYNLQNQFYRYLTHSRELDAGAFADVLGVSDDTGEGNATYGVIISPRCGPLNIEKPQTTVVHLLSLESVAAIYSGPSKTSDRVAIVSLHSWTYSCTPPNTVDFLDSMQDLGSGMQRLRAPDAVISRLSKAVEADDPTTKTPALPGNPAQRAWLARRLEDGFTFARHRLANGDVTSSLYRSVLSPNLVPHPLKEGDLDGDVFPRASSFGTDLQIVDHETGLADLTYNLAWELGRNLGTADKAFSSSLLRVRNAIHSVAIKEASEKALARVDALVSRKTLLAGLDNLTSRLEPSLAHIDSQPHPRWACGTETCGLATTRASTSFTSPAMAAALPESIESAAATVASDVDGNPYREVATAANPDWSILLNWILDKMFLKGIPPHYILPDTSHLPRESLRTFHIDDNWIDCLIDGALSIGNRFDKHDGAIRDAIKQQVNVFLQTKDAAGKYPSIPSWGFLMRSAAVGAFPNLEIKAALDNKTEPLSKLCILSVIGDDMLLCVFDRGPGTEGAAETFTISQPRHQQFYAVGAHVQGSHTDIFFRLPEDKNENNTVMGRWQKDGKIFLPFSAGEKETPTTVGGVEQVLDFETRTLKFPAFVWATAAALNGLEKGFSSQPADSSKITSAVVADILSQPNLKMTIVDGEATKTTTERPYREILVPKRADGAQARAQAALAVTADTAQRLPLKQPSASMSAAAAAALSQAPPASIAAVSTPSAIQPSAGSATQAAQPRALAEVASTLPAEPNFLRSEDFGENFQFDARALLSLDGENTQSRGLFGVPLSFDPPVYARGISVPLGTKSTRAVLSVKTLVQPAALALSKLVLRIPVGSWIPGGVATLFDHNKVLAKQQLAPQPRVVGPRWLCHANFELDLPDGGGSWYVVTVVPRAAGHPLFGWRLRDFERIDVLLPELDLAVSRNQGSMETAGERIYWPDGTVRAVERVKVQMQQEYTWQERGYWERVGRRSEEILLGKAIQLAV